MLLWKVRRPMENFRSQSFRLVVVFTFLLPDYLAAQFFSSTQLFYSILGWVRPLQEVALRQSPPSFSVRCFLVHTGLCCPTMPSLQRRFGLPTDLAPFICHSVLLIVHLSSFIRAMYPAHFNFVLVTYWTLVICLMMVCLLVSPPPPPLPPHPKVGPELRFAQNCICGSTWFSIFVISL